MKTSTISRLVTILAAGIILATFVVKDIASQRFKSDSDSLDRTSSMHFTLSYNLFLQDYLASIKQSTDLTMLRLGSNKNTSFENTVQELRIRIQSAQDHAKVLNEYTTSVEHLTEQLPVQSENKYTAAVLVKKSNKVQDEVNALNASLSSIVNKKRPVSSATGEVLGELSVLSDESKGIMDGANSLRSAFVSDLKLQREKVLNNYDFTLQVSYVLYALGWVVGLIGQLLPKDTDASRG